MISQRRVPQSPFRKEITNLIRDLMQKQDFRRNWLRFAVHHNISHEALIKYVHLLRVSLRLAGELPPPVYRQRRDRWPGLDEAIQDIIAKRQALGLRSGQVDESIPTWMELADQFGSTQGAVIQRASRLRRGLVAIKQKPAEVCECDELGPCSLPNHREEYERELESTG